LKDRTECARGQDKERINVRRAIFRLLASRDRSREEVVRKLKEKKFRPEAIAGEVEWFENQGLIDDRKFARSWIFFRLRFRPRAAGLIGRELREKGVAPELADQLLRQEITPEKEVEMARELARRRCRAYRKDDRFSARRKLVAYLGRRGFSYSTISAVLAEIFTDEFDGYPENIS